MKLGLAQINTTPGDFSGQRIKIMEMIDKAGEQRVDLLVFPELASCGYLSADLMHRSDYVEQSLFTVFQTVTDHSITFPEMTIVLGYLGRNTSGQGKPFTNSAAVIRGGIVIGQYHKQLLPFYDVFDEGRYFEPGKELCVFRVKDKLCGVIICEDLWNDKGQDDYNYRSNPVQQYRDIGCNLLASLNSSPFSCEKISTRLRMLEEITEESKLAIAYCNQVGAQDELIFDGHSAIVSNGSTRALCENWGEQLLVKDLEDQFPLSEYSSSKRYLSDLTNPEVLKEAIVLGLRDYVHKSGFEKVVLGSSGGIDSAVVAALACKALGSENVTCTMMPSKWSSEGSIKDAQELHKNLGCNELQVPIDYEQELYLLNQHLELDPRWFEPSEMERPENYNPVADENFQARKRGSYVMHFSNATGALPLTTGNKTELALGYCTLYGDMNGGFNPICDLYKRQVYRIAESFAEIPSSIKDKPPSAELAPNQTDEKNLQLSYSILDVIVRAYVEDYVADYRTFCKAAATAKWYTEVGQQAKILKWLHSKSKDLYESIIRRIDIMEYKRRQAAPGLKLSKVAFGTGRRIPIVKKV